MAFKGKKVADIYAELSLDKDELRRGLAAAAGDMSADADRVGKQLGDRMTAGIAQKVEALSTRVVKSRRDESKAADDVKLAELRLSEARDKGGQKASTLLALEQKLTQAQLKLADSSRAASVATRQHEDAQRRLGQAMADDIANIGKKIGPEAEKAGKDAGDKLTVGMKGSIVKGSPLIVAAVAGGLIAGAPLVMGAATTLFAGVGVLAAFQSDAVKSAWKGTWEQVKDGTVSAASSIEPVMVRVAGNVGAAFQRMQPQIATAFSAAAPQIETFTRGITGLAENALPGLVRAVQAGMPVTRGLADFLAKTGSGLTGFFDRISSHGPAAGQVFSQLGTTVATILPTLGQLIGQGVELGAQVLPLLNGSLGLVLKAVDLLGPALPAVATGLAAFKVVQLISGPMKSFAGSLDGIAAKIPSVSSAVGGTSSALEKLGGATAAVRSAMSRVAEDASAGFTAGSAAAGKFNESVRVAAVGGATALSQNMNRAVDGTVKGLLTLPPAAAAAGRGVAAGAGIAVDGIRAIPDVAQAAGRGLVSGLGAAVTGTVTGLRALPGVAADALRGVTAGVQAGARATGQALAEVPVLARAAVVTVASSITSAASTVQRGVQSMAATAADAARTAGAAVASAARTTGTALAALPGQAATAMQAVGSSIASGAQRAGTALVSGLGTAVSTTAHAITSIPAAVSQAEVALGTRLAYAAREAGAAVAGLPAQLSQVASAVGAGFTSSVTNAGAAVKGVFSQIPQAVDSGVSALGRATAAASGVATAFGQGVVSAVKQSATAVGQAASAVANGFMPTMAKAAAGASSALSNFGSALPAVGIGIALISAAMENSARKTDDFAHALLTGGAAAQQAQLEMANPSLWEKFTYNLTHWFNTQTVATAQLRDAAAASKELLAAMDPVSRAQTLQTQALNDLNFALEKHGAGSASAEVAERKYKDASDAVTAAEGLQQQAIHGVTQAMEDQANEALAAIDSGIALRRAQTEATQAEKTYQQALATGKVHLNDSSTATLDYETALSRVVAASGKAAADASGLTDKLDLQKVSTAAQLKTLYDLRGELGSNFPASLQAAITKLEGMGVTTDTTAGKLDALGAKNPQPTIGPATDKVTPQVNNLMNSLFDLGAAHPVPQADLNIDPAARNKDVMIGMLQHLGAQTPTPVAGLNPGSLPGTTNNLLGQVWNLGAQRPTPVAGVQDNASGPLQWILNGINALYNRTIYVTTVHQDIGVTGRGTAGQAAGGNVGEAVSRAARGFAAGGAPYRRSDGRIFGPGGPFDDMVPAVTTSGEPLRVSPSEWIINAIASARQGAAKMAALNAGQADIVVRRPVVPRSTSGLNPSTGTGESNGGPTITVGTLSVTFTGTGMTGDRQSMRRAALLLREELIKLERETA